MVNVRQIIFALLGSQSSTTVDHKSVERKSIAVVGAGTAGLAVLKTLLDLPDRNAWDIVLLEERENLGGIWLPEPRPMPPPIVPETPLYPLLHTNTPVPMMTCPKFPFPAGTHLYPRHEHVEAYLVHYANHFNLLPFTKFNHRVLSASWHGTAEAGVWNVTYLTHRNQTHSRAFQHLVVASGDLRTPRMPTWPGQKDWLDNSKDTGTDRAGREITHSVWYRRPEEYSNRSVLVVGDSASGRDIAVQIAPVVHEIYVSIRNQSNDHDITFGPFPSNVVRKPAISHFTPDSVVFVDNTDVDVDVVLLSTGYELRKPFLDAGDTLVTDPKAHSNASYQGRLISNTRYIFPLYRHIFSLSPSYPVTALSFVGLPSAIANCPSDVAQSLYIAYAIRDPNVLPSREQMLHELALQEQKLKDIGLDPYVLGHRLSDGTAASDYQDDLVDYLKQKGAMENDGQKFVDEWRRKIYTYNYLKRGWKRIETLDIGDEWVKGVETEEQWSDLMQRVDAWQEKYEES
ncbi:hypothetical protein AX17_001678 [Amanita inopinata Kibby_2008]|nr:hypothetical protein AX17_001678 [Amanita inopinata Kibby_2008]